MRPPLDQARLEELARAAHETYCRTCEHATGGPATAWDALFPYQREAWRFAVAVAIREATRPA